MTSVPLPTFESEMYMQVTPGSGPGEAFLNTTGAERWMCEVRRRPPFRPIYREGSLRSYIHSWKHDKIFGGLRGPNAVYCCASDRPAKPWSPGRALGYATSYDGAPLPRRSCIYCMAASAGGVHRDAAGQPPALWYMGRLHLSEGFEKKQRQDSASSSVC